MGHNPAMTESICNSLAPRMRPGLLLAVVMAILVVACGGPHKVTGKSPWVEVDGLSLDGSSLSLTMVVGNPNDRGIHLTGYRLRGLLDEKVLFLHNGTLDIDVSARGRERLEIPLESDPAGLERLQVLDAGERASLPFRLEGEIRIDDQRDHDIGYRSYLHRAPGRPGHFR